MCGPPAAPPGPEGLAPRRPRPGTRGCRRARARRGRVRDPAGLPARLASAGAGAGGPRRACPRSPVQNASLAPHPLCQTAARLNGSQTQGFRNGHQEAFGLLLFSSGKNKKSFYGGYKPLNYTLGFICHWGHFLKQW